MLSTHNNLTGRELWNKRKYFISLCSLSSFLYVLLGPLIGQATGKTKYSIRSVSGSETVVDIDGEWICWEEMLHHLKVPNITSVTNKFIFLISSLPLTDER